MKLEKPAQMDYVQQVQKNERGKNQKPELVFTNTS